MVQINQHIFWHWLQSIEYFPLANLPSSAILSSTGSLWETFELFPVWLLCQGNIYQAWRLILSLSGSETKSWPWFSHYWISVLLPPVPSCFFLRLVNNSEVQWTEKSWKAIQAKDFSSHALGRDGCRDWWKVTWCRMYVCYPKCLCPLLCEEGTHVGHLHIQSLRCCYLLSKRYLFRILFLLERLIDMKTYVPQCWSLIIRSTLY